MGASGQLLNRLAESLLLASGIAYLYGVAWPRPLMDKPLILEKLGYLACAVLILGNLLILRSRLLWLVLGAVYVGLSLASYTGSVVWRVGWGDASEAAQMCMWLWDLAIAVASFLMGGV
jgi:hypothetical protein